MPEIIALCDQTQKKVYGAVCPTEKYVADRLNMRLPIEEVDATSGVEELIDIRREGTYTHNIGYDNHYYS